MPARFHGAVLRAPQQEHEREEILGLQRNRGTEGTELSGAPERAGRVGARLRPVAPVFAGHPVPAGHLEHHREQAGKQSDVLGQVEGAW